MQGPSCSSSTVLRLLAGVVVALSTTTTSDAFVLPSSSLQNVVTSVVVSPRNVPRNGDSGRSSSQPSSSSAVPMTFGGGDNRSEEEIEEEVRLQIWEGRRNQIRGVFSGTEQLRKLRLEMGWVDPLEEDPETGELVRQKSKNNKLAVTITAVVVAIGAVTLRIGGRAALVSAVGLDFANDNPEMQANLQQILETADNMDPLVKFGFFVAAWTAVKVLCFDTGGIPLALASGILFGGVLQGAVASATAATIGSSVAFSLAKLPTPVRTKALELLDEYPSLRGIEKVVAEDGLKAILTLRLAPIIPIPIGLYNYVYGVTNVPYLDFAGGIFLGSLKPYLLDSYLGYFGKEVLEGSAGDTAGSFQDILLLVVLGASVLIGVFASQLASETYDSVLAEIEADQKAKRQAEGEDEEEEDIVRQVLGLELPEWMLKVQLQWRQATHTMEDVLDREYQAQYWNTTKPVLASSTTTGSVSVPATRPSPTSTGVAKITAPVVERWDPAKEPIGPELQGANKGIDYLQGLYESFALSPLLFQTIATYSDPLYSPEADAGLEKRNLRRERQQQGKTSSFSTSLSRSSEIKNTFSPITEASQEPQQLELSREDQLRNRIQRVRQEAVDRIQDLDDRINSSK